MAKNAASKAYNQAAKDAINLARLEAGSAAKAKAFLAGLEGDLVKILADNKDLAPGKRAKLETILKSSQDAIGKTYADMKADNASDLKGVVSYQSKSAGKLINESIGVDVMGSVLTESQISSLVKDTNVFGHFAKDWWDAQSDDLKFRFKAAIQQGYAIGEDVDQLTRRIRGTKAKNFTDGVMQTSKREAETLVRTSVQTISNAARLESYAQLSDTIKGIEWVSTLDTRTTLTCRGLDGKIWTYPGLNPVGHDKVFPGPIAHWNCRSTQIPVLYSWEELSGKKIKALDGETYAERLKARLKEKGMSDEQIAKAEANARASMDGQASGAPEMDKWMKSKSDSFNREILGPSRFNLMKSGRLTVTDLTDQNNRPLTVAQLHAGLDNGTLPVETEGFAFEPFDLKKAKAPTQATAKAVQDAAAKRIAEVMENPKGSGNSILATSLVRIQAAEPSLTPAETLAKAEELTIARVAANTKSSTLSRAKKAILADKTPTAAQQTVIDELGDDERAAWLESVADARKAREADETEAKLAAAASAIQETIGKKGADMTAADVASTLQNLDTEGLPKAVEDALAGMLKAGAVQAKVDEITAALKDADFSQGKVPDQLLDLVKMLFPEDLHAALKIVTDLLKANGRRTRGPKK